MDVVEIIVRGVGGETAEEILGGEVYQTSGDDHAGFYRSYPPQAEPAVPEARLGERSRSRLGREAYEWGRLTSGPSTSAGWWVLLPFTLFNVTGWMLPVGRPVDGPDGRTWEAGTAEAPLRSRLWWARLAVVVGGGLLTALYVLWLSAILIGVIALGCDGDCADRGVANVLRLSGGDETWRMSVGATLVVLVWLGILWYVQRSHTLEWYERDEGRRVASTLPDRDGRVPSRLVRTTRLEDPAFWYRWGEYRRLWRWHLGVSAVAVGTAVAVASDGAPRLGAASLLPLVASLLGFALVSDAERRPDDRAQRPRSFLRALASGVVHTSMAVAAVWVVGLVDVGWFDDMPTPAASLILLIRLLTIALFVVGLVLVAVQWGGGPGRERRLTPVAAAAFAVAVAGAGLGSVYVLAGRGLMGRDEFDALRADTTFPDVLAVSLLVVLVVWLVLVLARPGSNREVVDDYFPGRAEPGVEETWMVARTNSERVAEDLSAREWRWVRKVRRMRGYSEVGGRAPGVLVWTTLVIVAVIAAEFVRGGMRPVALDPVPLFGLDALAAVHGWSAGLIVAFVFPGVWIMRLALRGRKERRAVAKVWDVLGFWPRRFHPFAAPSYAERAVPELRDRVKHHLSEGAGVIVSAHSQGTVIAYAALRSIAAEGQVVAQVVVDVSPEGAPMAYPAAGDADSEAPLTLADLRTMSRSEVASEAQYEHAVASGPRADDDLTRVALATYGSPLSQLYGPNFPATFGLGGGFQELRDRLLRVGAKPAWRNFYRPTDYIGKEVFVAPGGILDPPDDEADVRLLEAVDLETGLPLPLIPPESHSNYEREPALRAWLSDLVPHLAGRRVKGPGPPGDG